MKWSRGRRGIVYRESFKYIYVLAKFRFSHCTQPMLRISEGQSIDKLKFGGKALQSWTLLVKSVDWFRFSW